MRVHMKVWIYGVLKSDCVIEWTGTAEQLAAYEEICNDNDQGYRTSFEIIP